MGAEGEQKGPQGERSCSKDIFKHKYPQLKAKHRKHGVSLPSWPRVTLQKPEGSSGQPGHQEEPRNLWAGAQPVKTSVSE